MTVRPITLRSLKLASFNEQYSQFLSLYKKLFTQQELSQADRRKLLSIAVLFTNADEEAMKRLGYRIALAYGNKTNDYIPLYDIAINSGLIPIAALIKRIEELPINLQTERKDSFISNVVASYIDSFRKDDIVLTEQQLLLNSFFDSNLSQSSTVVAPTSYGKSELIISAVKQSAGAKICIIVPSKSLLAQTRRRLINANIEWVTRIVSHPEMHRAEDTSSVYILTQERLTRILNSDKNMFFDMVIVDEAHNMLDGDNRSLLLTATIKMLDYRNPSTAFKFLTPFIQDVSNLDIRETSFQPQEFSIDEYVKSEQLIIADYRQGDATTDFYDHFLHEFIPLENGDLNVLSYIRNNAQGKNIIYFNKPRNVQEFAVKLASNLPEVESDLISEAINEIGSSVHNQYLLLKCIRKGVVYHHGSMADSVRNYAEFLYRNCPEIKYLVASSTLLEGVNLPIEKIFLLEISKGARNLSPSQFKNLIGRVSRFGEVFGAAKTESLEKLQPEIHLVATDEYSRAGANYRTFVEKVMRINKKADDKLENVLLEKTPITPQNEDTYKDTLTRLENIETGITKDFQCPVASTPVGLKLLESNIREIKVFEKEAEIQSALIESYTEIGKVRDSNTLMRVIAQTFIAYIDPEARGKAGLLRLNNEKAQAFYAMFLDWKTENVAMSRMVRRFIDHWDQYPSDTPIFVGHRWGDTTIEGSYSPLYTSMGGKDLSQKINLAIVRIKEEEDFFDYEIFRFIEILNELEMIDETFFKKAKYGTSDSNVITLIKNGFSRGVAELLLEDYPDYFELREDDTIQVDPSIHSAMEEDKIGFLQRYEIGLNVKAES